MLGLKVRSILNGINVILFIFPHSVGTCMHIHRLHLFGVTGEDWPPKGMYQNKVDVSFTNVRQKR